MKLILNHYEKIKLIIFILLIASLPFYLFVSSILIIIATLLSLLKAYPFNSFDNVKLDELSVILISYFILELIGLSYTDKENIANGIFNLQKHLGLIFVPLVFFDFKINIRDRKILLFTFVISCFIASLICVIFNIFLSLSIYNMLFHDWRFSHERLSEPIGMSPAYFSMYLSISILIILNYFKENILFLSSIKKILITLLLLYFLVVVIALGARTITVTLMVIIILNMFQYARSQKSYKVLLLAVLVPFVFIGFIFLHPIVKTRFMDMMKSKYESTNYGSYFARSKIWGPGIEAIKENFWLGVGTGDDQIELEKKYIKYNYQEGVKNGYNMHNQYLQTLLSIGIIGLLIFLLVLFIQLKNGFIKRDLLYLSFLVLFMCGCITESMLCRQNGIILFLVFSFIFYKSEKELFC